MYAYSVATAEAEVNISAPATTSKPKAPPVFDCPNSSVLPHCEISASVDPRTSNPAPAHWNRVKRRRKGGSAYRNPITQIFRFQTMAMSPGFTCSSMKYRTLLTTM